MADRYLLESGAPDGYLLEDGSGVLLLESPYIAFVATSSASSASANSLTPSEPTGAAQNDIIIASCGIAVSGGTWTAPADFTELSQEDFGAGGASGSGYLGWKRRGVDEGSGYNFVSSSAATSMSVILTTWRGVDTTNALDVTFSEGSHMNETLNSLVAAAPAITTVTDSALVVIHKRWCSAIAGITHGVPAGYTERANLLNANRSVLVASKEIGTAGTETPGVWTTTGAAGTEDMINWTVALRLATSAAAVVSGYRSLLGVGV